METRKTKISHREHRGYSVISHRHQACWLCHRCAELARSLNHRFHRLTQIPSLCSRTGLFFVLAVICLFGLPVQGALYSGGGTEADPYIINTAAEMNDIGANPGDWGSYFLLTADINLGGYTGTSFNIIGSTGTPLPEFLTVTAIRFPILHMTPME